MGRILKAYSNPAISSEKLHTILDVKFGGRDAESIHSIHSMLNMAKFRSNFRLKNLISNHWALSNPPMSALLNTDIGPYKILALPAEFTNLTSVIHLFDSWRLAKARSDG